MIGIAFLSYGLLVAGVVVVGVTLHKPLPDPGSIAATVAVCMVVGLVGLVSAYLVGIGRVEPEAYVGGLVGILFGLALILVWLFYTAMNLVELTRQAMPVT